MSQPEFKPSPFKVTILSLDKKDDAHEVTAQYNPKEVQVDKAVAWSKKDDKNTVSDKPVLEFSGGQGRTMSLELLFDSYEKGGNVHALYISKLLEMATIIDPKGNANTKRPHQVQVVWGDNGLPEFKGVIESVSTKYTMFSKDGIPVRATCTVKLKEADGASFKKPTTR
jgi:hypothetical protein